MFWKCILIHCHTFVFNKLNTSFLLAIGKSFTVLNISLRNILALNKNFKLFLYIFITTFCQFAYYIFQDISVFSLNNYKRYTLSYLISWQSIILPKDFIQHIQYIIKVLPLHCKNEKAFQFNMPAKKLESSQN